MKVRSALVVVCTVCGLYVTIPSLTWAQEEQKTVGEEKESIVYKKTTIIDFSDVTITGELTKPEGSYLMNKKNARFDLLIRVRDDFLHEIQRTADNL